MKNTPTERFESKFYPEPNTGCFLWAGAISFKRGYGSFYLNGKIQYSHRVSYQLYKGHITTGLHVLHTCDNPSCVNPDHLFLGTIKDNSIDMIKKGRGWQPDCKGEENGRSKINEAQVLEIRRSTLKPKELSKIYGLSAGTLHKIRTGKLWGHVKAITSEAPKTSFRHEERFPEMYLNKK